MKIVGRDNFDRDNVNDALIATGVDKFHGHIMVKALNDTLCSDDNDQTFYELMPDDYELKKWEP